MILKVFLSRLLHPSSPLLQDRISLPFQLLQALIAPQIVFWLLLMLCCPSRHWGSQWPQELGGFLLCSSVGQAAVPKSD